MSHQYLRLIVCSVSVLMTSLLGLPTSPYAGVALGVNASCNAGILAWRSQQYRRAFRSTLHACLRKQQQTTVVHVIAARRAPNQRQG